MEMAANGADIVVLNICGSVSSASNAAPASMIELNETADGVRKLGRKCKTIRADIRNMASLRTIAAGTKSEFGKIILVANAAIQRWKPLLEMEDADWNDVINNNLNGTANTVRAFAPGMVSASMAGSSCFPRCRASRAPRGQAPTWRRSGASSGS